MVVISFIQNFAKSAETKFHTKACCTILIRSTAAVSVQQMIPRKLKRRNEQTNVAKYGCESVLQNKEILNKKVQTTIERYGENYGVTIREKGSQTNLEKYDVKCRFNDEYHQQKRLLQERVDHYDKFVKLLAEKRIELVTPKQDYCDGCTLFEYRCIDCGKMWTSTMHDSYHMRVCSCHNTGVGEAAFLDLLKNEYGMSIIQHNRTLVKPYEIDFWLPDIKVGFEYNGLYWHSTKFREPSYHQTKAKLAIQAGISLYTITETSMKYTRFKSSKMH